MTLTLGDGPLAATPPSLVNYAIEGPEHRLLLQPFPHRIRAIFDGVTLLDSARGSLLHESAHLPVLYVPREDLVADVLEATNKRTHCPYKGDASYLTVRTDTRAAENAVWFYPEPLPPASWLTGLVAVDWNLMDTWFEEDERVLGHLRDPYHRVDVREGSWHVRVRANGEIVAETDRPKLLFETGLDTRYYIPPEDVRRDLLEPSATTTVCSYKGEASWWSLREGSADVAWSYEDPLPEAAKARGHLTFDGEGIDVAVEAPRADLPGPSSDVGAE